ncbi:MAG: hypothetical protein WCT40_00070 [Candidatus Magasanikbacteria bacterium]
MKIESAKEFINRRSKHFQDVLDKYKKTKKDNLLKWLPDINRKGRYGFIREAWTLMPQFNTKEKIFIIERFRRVKIKRPITHKKLKIGEIEYRFGYYMVGKNGNKINKWTWGESCPIIPREDLEKLLKKAKKEKTIL